jgi:hypothetical protein
VREEEIGVGIGEDVGGFGAAWVVGFLDGFAGQAVRGAELELRMLSLVLENRGNDCPSRRWLGYCGTEGLTLNGSALISCGVVVRQSKLPRSTRASNCRRALCSRLSFSMSPKPFVNNREEVNW